MLLQTKGIKSKVCKQVIDQKYVNKSLVELKGKVITIPIKTAITTIISKPDAIRIRIQNALPLSSIVNY